MRHLLFIAGAVVTTGADALVLDDFMTGAYSKTIQSGTDLAFQSGSMIGGIRNTFLEVQDNPFGEDFHFEVGNGLAVISSGAGLNGYMSLSYGWESDGGGGRRRRDLHYNFVDSGIDRFKLQFQRNDLPLLVTVVVESGSGNGRSSFQRVVLGGRNSPFVEEFLVSSLSGNADIADIDQIEWGFDSIDSGDYVIGKLEAVPEPASMAVLGAGLAFLAARRRTKR